MRYETSFSSDRICFSTRSRLACKWQNFLGFFMRKRSLVLLLTGIGLCSAAHADETAATNTNPDDTWALRAVAGFSKTSGNTDTTTGNGQFHVAHVIDNWKFLFGLQGLYGSTKSETTAQDFGLE